MTIPNFSPIILKEKVLLSSTLHLVDSKIIRKFTLNYQTNNNWLSDPRGSDQTSS
jgi:hypothetical protein